MIPLHKEAFRYHTPIMGMKKIVLVTRLPGVVQVRGGCSHIEIICPEILESRLKANCVNQILILHRVKPNLQHKAVWHMIR